MICEGIINANNITNCGLMLIIGLIIGLFGGYVWKYAIGMNTKRDD